jgi:phosphoribosyl-ATP pyrophosphohydrolase/phosphoribosyl-AMP cyclohydrolase/histidinol dehydrogenase
MSRFIPIRPLEEVAGQNRTGVDQDAISVAAEILARLETGGERELLSLVDQFEERPGGMNLVLTADDLAAAHARLTEEDRARLERIAGRIRTFAEAQLATVGDLDGVAVPGGRAGHTVTPVDRAGCYAPGGRYPLPSSVLMTAITARVAGVSEVWVASPRPAPITLAAAAVAGVDGFLVAGGAHAIGALALGIGGPPPCDVIVGPGNRYVTAAKHLVFGRAGIDMLAGPSELVVLADGAADPAVVAADLIAQAEHDPEALPVLVTTDSGLAERVQKQVADQLADLPTADIAAPALEGGATVLVDSFDAGIAACDAIAPEHLQLSVANPDEFRRRLRHYGAVFVGEGAAEVFGDYGVGPNHVLPTGGTARFTGGLSVVTFLRVRTWLEVEPTDQLLEDTAWLARQEGLEGHARAAEQRGR